jgi:hypothetical protein
MLRLNLGEFGPLFLTAFLTVPAWSDTPERPETAKNRNFKLP